MCAAAQRARPRRMELVPHRRAERRVRLRQVDRAARPLPASKVSFLGGLHHPSGPKADPHVCSDMWLTGAPLHNPQARAPTTRSGSTRSIALHTKQFCRQPVARAVDRRRDRLPVAHRHHLLQPRRAPDPGREQPAPRLRSAVPRRPRVAGDRTRRRLQRRDSSSSTRWLDSAQVAQPASSAQSDRERMDQYLTSLNEVESRLAASEKWIDVPLEEAGLLASQARRARRKATRRADYYRNMFDLIAPGVRRRHHAVGGVHAQPRRRHGHQRHVPDQARPRPVRTTTCRTPATRKGNWPSRSTTCFLSEQLGALPRAADALSRPRRQRARQHDRALRQRREHHAQPQQPAHARGRRGRTWASSTEPTGGKTTTPMSNMLPQHPALDADRAGVVRRQHGNAQQPGVRPRVECSKLHGFQPGERRGARRELVDLQPQVLQVADEQVAERRSPIGREGQVLAVPESPARRHDRQIGVVVAPRRRRGSSRTESPSGRAASAPSLASLSFGERVPRAGGILPAR